MNDYIKLSISQIPDYFMNLFEVSIHPRTFINRFMPIDKENVNKAFIFFGITVLLTYILEIPILPHQNDLLYYFLIMATVSGLFLLGVIFILTAVWKIVGGKASVSELFVCTAYIMGPSSYIFLAFGLIGESLFMMIDPELAAALRQNPLTPLPEEPDELLGFQIRNSLYFLGILLSSAWATAAWRSYRTINRVSKFRSILAYLLCVVFAILCALIGIFMSVPWIMPDRF